MRRGRDAQKPELANGKLPFTPIFHKNVNDIGTPYKPLHVDDLDTPKQKGAKPIPQVHTPDPVPERSEPDGCRPGDLQELRQALVMCVDIVGRLERASESKVYRSVGTQTQSSGHRPGHQPPKLVRPLEVTEVVFSDDSQSSPVPKPTQGKMQQQDPDVRPKGRRPLATRAVNAAAPAKLEQFSSTDNVDGPPKPAENPNLQKRIHEMSLLLKRLETQLDGMNAPV
jgi:hypothetical protein